TAYGARSTFGLTLQAIRDNPRRMSALGYSVTAHRVYAFFLAALFFGNHLKSQIPRGQYRFRHMNFLM
ncbi:MAG: hypothetical protein AAFY70_11260, partial [Bacteroidota bacterium]